MNNEFCVINLKNVDASNESEQTLLLLCDVLYKLKLDVACSLDHANRVAFKYGTNHDEL